jgi:hypothetical protein
VTVLLLLGVVFGVSLSVDAETARLLNTIVNFATLVLIYWHRREVKPKVEKIEENTDHLEAALANSLPGGRRSMDPPTPEP